MAEIKIDENDVKDFWKWFLQNHRYFGDNFNNQQLIEKLDEWIYKLGNFSWELGPGINEPNALVISPHGDIELLGTTQKIISFAPSIVGWEFHYSTPPKSWNLIFEMQNQHGKTITVDANDWRYVLLKYPDNKFEIVIRASVLKELDKTTQISGAEILLDGILGEERRLNLIDGIEVVDEFESNQQQKSSDIKNLGAHLSKLTT